MPIENDYCVTKIIYVLGMQGLRGPGSREFWNSWPSSSFSHSGFGIGGGPTGGGPRSE